MKVGVGEVLAAIEREADGAGYDPLSRLLSRAIVLSHLAKWPRVDVVREYVRDIGSVASSDITIAIKESAPLSLLVDAHGLPAIAALKVAESLALQAVTDKQVSALGLINTGGMRTLDVWARVLVEMGVVPLIAWNGGPYVAVPYGGVDPFFGTNPFAYAIPTGNEPVVGDMATSEIAYMDLTAARKSGAYLPADVGLDEAGVPTKDPRKIFVEPDSARLLPLGGGPKGSSLMFLFEYLTGALVGGMMGRSASPMFTASEFGGIIIMLPEDLFRPKDEVRAEVDGLTEEIRRSRPVTGIDTVRLPGDRSLELLSAAETDGLDLDDATVALLGLSNK